MIEDYLSGIAGFFQRSPYVVVLDALDILIVATLIYFGLSLIKGTRGMQMSIGLALIFVVHQLARRFQLNTIWTILDTLLTYSVLFIVVIFQSEIRRALMRVGQRPFFRSGGGGRETQVIEEVIKAATALAQRRIGALIVFERDAELDEFIEPGTTVDAAVSKELLYGVFIPSFENPMHDGAVIIREGRVWQAGAFLPLSVSARLDKTLGARHRAAIGISEESDAVVIVVSEERGAISLCFGGNVVRNLDGPSLREALHGLFQRRQKKTKSKTAPGGKARPATGDAERPPASTESTKEEEEKPERRSRIESSKFEKPRSERPPEKPSITVKAIKKPEKNEDAN